jgi:trigger factor
MMDEFSRRMLLQGSSIEQYAQFTGVSPDMLYEQAKPQALKRIQYRLAMEAVAKEENLEASEEEYARELEKMAEDYRMDKDKILDILGEDGAKQVREDICIRKALDFVVGHSVEG